MHISLQGRIGIVPALFVGEGTAGGADQKRPVRVAALHRFGHAHAVDTVFFEVILQVVPPVRLVQFVVRRPKHQAGPVVIPVHHRFHFPGNLFQKNVVLGKDAAGQHEILKNHNAVLIAQVEEIIGLINTAAPDPQHAQVGLHRPADVEIIIILANLAVNTVGGHPVGPPDKKPPPVDLKLELPSSKPILFLMQHYGTDPEAKLSAVCFFPVFEKHRRHVIEVCFPIGPGPPQPGIFQGKLRFRPVGGQFDLRSEGPFKREKQLCRAAVRSFLPERVCFQACRQHCPALL